jgi:hypothetical protein
MQVKYSTGAHDAGAGSHSPELWRLLLGLVLWGLACAQEYVGPGFSAMGSAGTWFCLRYPTWKASVDALKAPVGLRQLREWLGVVAFALFVTAGLKQLEPNDPQDGALDSWSLLALWLLIPALAIGRFVMARNRWLRARRV